MLKVIHIHTDFKFLIETERFNKFFFLNTLILIGEDFACNKVYNFNEVYSFQPIILSSKEADLIKVVNICSTADIVVLYELDPVKSYIALKIPRNITIAWRFFGAELYDRNIEHYLSKSTLKYYNTKKEKLTKILNNKIVYGKILSWIKHRSYPDNYFTDAIRRVDLFLCLSKYEYNHLAQSWNHLPAFIQIPFHIKCPERIIDAKSNLVIIGNSRSIYNNHIDIIELIENVHFKIQFCFLIPFSYGTENYYTREIRRRVDCSQKHIELLENFMPYELYFNLVGRAKAAVFNCYRQRALGNIFEFINSGTKIYLNIHNDLYQWFKDFGLKIFTIEDFASDLESNNLELEYNDKERNIRTLNHMLSQFSEKRFIKEINTFLKQGPHKIQD